jgi:predicted nucleic acid-binding protein
VELAVDTTVLIDALRGLDAAKRLRRLREDGARPPWICAINIDELYRGARANEEPELERFLGGLRLAPLGHAEAEQAGRWRRDFAQRGITLSQADCLIAAAALGVGARLATANVKDFPMPELTIQHWPNSR